MFGTMIAKALWSRCYDTVLLLSVFLYGINALSNVVHWMPLLARTFRN